MHLFGVSHPNHPPPFLGLPCPCRLRGAWNASSAGLQQCVLPGVFLRYHYGGGRLLHWYQIHPQKGQTETQRVHCCWNCLNSCPLDYISA